MEEKRSFVRYDLGVPAQLSVSPGGTFRGTIIDLSEGGLRIITSQPLEVGSSVEVAATLFRATAEVVWRSVIPDGAVLGMKFTHIPDDQKRALAKLLVSLERHRADL